MITAKRKKRSTNAKKTERHAAMLEIPERAYEDCQGQTQKGYSEQLPDDNADFTDRGGGAFEAVRPKDNARALEV